MLVDLKLIGLNYFGLSHITPSWIRKSREKVISDSCRCDSLFSTTITLCHNHINNNPQNPILYLKIKGSKAIIPYIRYLKTTLCKTFKCKCIKLSIKAGNPIIMIINLRKLKKSKSRHPVVLEAQKDEFLQRHKAERQVSETIEQRAKDICSGLLLRTIPEDINLRECSMKWSFGELLHLVRNYCYPFEVYTISYYIEQIQLYLCVPGEYDPSNERVVLRCYEK